jgi:hypothetical protein
MTCTLSRGLKQSTAKQSTASQFANEQQSISKGSSNSPREKTTSVPNIGEIQLKHLFLQKQCL